MNERFNTLKVDMWFDLQDQTKEQIKTYAENQYNKYIGDIPALAALVTVLNHRCWQFHKENKEELSLLYADLYYMYNSKIWDWLEEHGSKEEKDWYFYTMD